jgi:hypothetical protein
VVLWMWSRRENGIMLGASNNLGDGSKGSR